MLLAPFFIVASAAVIGLLGAGHLFLTYRSKRFDPRDAALTAALAVTSPLISDQTTMARAAQGFHASHSLGFMLFALVWSYLALFHWSMLEQSLVLLTLGLAMLLAYLMLARRYWFSVPLRGIALANALYAAGLGMVLLAT
ncbi:MAG: hypothetical protein RR720_09110 [Comamonas sp.]|uniref:LIC_13387 family protein n=1 Tax=Comamonas sp. TaxID=34028 RepID=UPI002FC687EC